MSVSLLRRGGIARRLAFAALIVSALSGTALADDGQARDGGTLKMGIESNLPGFDPLKLGALADRTVAMAFYDTLMRIDEQGRIQPNLIAKLKATDGGRTYVATLRQHVRFQDGTPFNAEAVVFNFRRVANPENGCRCAASVAPLKSVEKLGPYKVAFHLKAPNASFPSVLADVPGMEPSPTAIRKAEKSGGHYGEHPVGTGPFTFVSWQRGVAVVGKRNADYWKKGLPHLERVVFRPIPDQQTRLQTLRSGGIQLMMTPAPQSVKAVQQGRRNAKVTEVPGLGTTFMMFQTQRAPLDDARVRRALAHATNRPLILKSVGQGLYPQANSPFGRGMPEGRQDVDFPDYDPDKARQLLKDYGKPVEFTMSVLATPQSVLFAQVLQQMWQQVGVDVSIKQLEGLHLINQASHHDFQAMLFRWAGRPDPDQNVYQFFYSSSPRNYTQFKNERMDELLDAGRTTLDRSKREAIYHQVSELLARQVPYLYLLSGKNFFLSSPQVHDLPKTPDGVARLGPVWLAK